MLNHVKSIIIIMHIIISAYICRSPHTISVFINADGIAGITA